MKIKFADKIYEVLYTMKVLGKSIYAVEDEPNHIDWLVNVEVIDEEEKSMKVYRVENEAEQKGLWRKFDGTYEPLFDMLTDGQCRDLPMEDSPIYREEGKKWFASAPSKETLQKWFSKRDLEELVAKGFTISEFEVTGYRKVSDFEYIFTRDNIINRNYFEVSDIYPEQKEVENYKQQLISEMADLVVDYIRQKPTWTEEDELMLKDTIEFIETGWSDNSKSHLVYWLKSIKDKFK